MTDVPDLITAEAAAQELRLSADEVAGLLQSGQLRRVWYREGNNPDAPLEQFVMGADVARLVKENDPRHLAALVRGEAKDHNPESPHNLAGTVPRL